jgi:hypothetical protein
MKTIVSVAVLAVLIVVTPSPCFALWEIEIVTKERAKELNMELRSKAAGPKDVRVELEFKVEGELKNFSRVDLRLSDGEKSLLTAPLQEDRSRPGHVVVSFSADRTRLDKIKLWVMVPGVLGGVIHELRVKDFVELEKDR